MTLNIAQSTVGSATEYTLIFSNVTLRADAGLKYMGISFESYSRDGDGIDFGGNDGLTRMETDNSYGTLLEAVTTAIDSQSTLSELQMLNLNTAITEFSELNSALSSIMDSISQSLQAIASNL